MKSKLLAVGLSVSLLVFLFSCSKNNDDERNIKITTLGNDINSVNYIKLQLDEKLNLKRSTSSRSIVSSNTTELSDEEAELIVRPIISPLVENGRDIYSQMLNQVINTPEWNNLTQEEKSMILNFDDKQMAELSLAFTTEPIHVDALSSTQPRKAIDIVRNCVSFALGIQGIKTLISETSALVSVNTAIGILKIIGKRYLSYVGIAWMVWDFADCVTSF